MPAPLLGLILLFAILLVFRDTPMVATLALVLAAVALWRGVWSAWDATDEYFGIKYGSYRSALISIVVGLLLLYTFSESNSKLFSLVRDRF